MGLTIDDIDQRFRANIARVRGLVTTFESLAGKGRGRSTVADADVLRAAVVFLHATPEDLLRSSEELRLPIAKAEAFRRPGSPGDSWLHLPEPGDDKGKMKFTMVDLARFRGQTVDAIFEQAVDRYLTISNYNNVGDIKTTLDRTNLITAWMDSDALRLSAMMARRHWIAHRADVNQKRGSGQHAAKHIAKQDVLNWVACVESLGERVLKTLRGGPP